MSNPINTILGEEFTKEQIEAMPEVDENESVEREKDEEHSEAMAQAENNFNNSL
jgi:hypothetical protein